MDAFTFQAIGTHWTISIDGATFSEKTKEDILGLLRVFEARYSRFLPGSEVNAFRERAAGEYPVSEDLARMLARAAQLRAWTNGAFDPVVGAVLEHAGYDRSLTFCTSQERPLSVPAWAVKEEILSIDGPAVFDVGGIGKGYAIDLVADFLRREGFEHFLIEGGGDMVGTRKADGSGWRVAVAWPGKGDEAISIVTLVDQGFAASDTLLRRWGKWHHLIDMRTGTPVTEQIGCAVVARNAFDADAMTSVVSLLSFDEAAPILALFGATALQFCADGRVHIDPGWSGELFAST